MQHVLIIGATKAVKDIIKIIVPIANMKIKAIIAKTPETAVEKLANKFSIPIYASLQACPKFPIDIVIDTTNDQQIFEQIQATFTKKSLFISHSLTKLLLPFLKSQNAQINNLTLILNNIRDGLIVIDREGYIKLMNDSAKNLININKEVIGKHIKQVFPRSQLSHVLSNREKEVNKKYTLHNGREVVVTRIPLIDEKNHLIGAFSIFKETSEVIRLAEENTDLKEIKTLLEAIIHSSEEAINVVNEDGIVLMVNPAYTKITGLSEKAVIGKPATFDISEGESIHYEVLKTRRAVRGAKLKVGPNKKEVIVNAAPIIVEGKLKGSVAVVHDISKIHQLTSELQRAKQIIRSLEASYTFEDIIGDSSEIALAIEQAKIAAQTPVTVLLRGASGTGKELFAHAIHNASDRKYNKFIRVNCASLAESVLESELFGYEEGAFTGARVGGKKGLFEEAHHGSIFLDEIGELSLTTQAKLLRVLQEKEIVRVGGTTPIPIDVRIITATNANLEKKITNKEFREDLYYRLNRLPIFIPSLVERIDDLPNLVHHIIHKVNQMYGRNVTTISQGALEKLTDYDWPGNIRELENIIARAVIFMDMNEATIEAQHIPKLKVESPVKDVYERARINDEQVTLQRAMDTYEKQFIQHVYEKNDFNKTKTAKQLNISIRSLYYKLEKFGIE